jgi:flagellar protein FlaJ
VTDREAHRRGDGSPDREPSLDDETAEAVLENAFEENNATSFGESRDAATVSDCDDPERGPERERGFRPLAGSEPTPEETISRPLHDRRELDGTGRAAIRETYGYVRAHFKTRPDRYRGLQRRLKQARIRGTYDTYLTESARGAALAGVLGWFAGATLAIALVATGAPVEAIAPSFSVPGASWLREMYLAHPLLVMIVGLSGLGSAGTGAGVWIWRNHVYPQHVVSARRRSIDRNLPYAITFVYALSRGGTNVVDAVRRLADADHVYGEVANEFDVVVREIDLFGNDLLGALNNVRALTPSDNLERFLDDLLGVLESGGDLETFLEEEAEEYLDEALEGQEAFIQTLGVLSELFVVAFVAAPLFLIVVLIVVSFIGAETVGYIALLIYGVFPIGMAGFLFLIHLLSRPYEEPAASLDAATERTVSTDMVAEDPRFPAYRRARRTSGWRALLSDPLRAIRRRPVLSLWVTIPIGVAVVGFVVATGEIRPTATAFVSAPIRTTAGLVVAPLLATTVPLMVLHERERRRTRRIARRFPDVLSILASANEMGVELIDGLELVTRHASGTLAEELRKVRNDVAWNHDLTRALLSFADRLRVARLTRTMTLVAEGSRASGDLQGLLEIAAADARARMKLDRARRREVGSYVTIVVIGFLMYLLVIVMVSASYLEPIGELAMGTAAPDQPEAIANVGSVPVETYRLLFLHSALIQGFGSGLIAGKLAENDVLNGLKYGIALVSITVVAFVLFV